MKISRPTSQHVVHLVGDIHQPLHAGWGEDRGGNTYQLQAFMRGEKKSLPMSKDFADFKRYLMSI